MAYSYLTDAGAATATPTGQRTSTATSVTAGSGDVATDVIFDAKGDLAVGTGSDTAARLAVGANTYVLTADSSEATGLKWAAPASGTASATGFEQTFLMMGA